MTEIKQKRHTFGGMVYVVAKIQPDGVFEDGVSHLIVRTVSMNLEEAKNTFRTVFNCEPEIIKCLPYQMGITQFKLATLETQRNLN